MKVPSTHCDARVQTVCANVMNLPRDQIRSLSTKVCVCQGSILFWLITYATLYVLR